MSILMLDVLIWPILLVGGLLILVCVGIVGLSILFAVRIIRKEKRKTSEAESPSPEQPKEEIKES